MIHQPVMKKPMDRLDYNLIDESLRYLINYFDYCGIRTKWCCSGHEDSKHIWDTLDRVYYAKLFGQDILDDYISYNSYITFRLKKQVKFIFNKFPKIENCFIFIDDKSIRIFYKKQMNDNDIKEVWKEILKHIQEVKQ